MIGYANDAWQINVLCQSTGSVLPRAAAMGSIATLLCAGAWCAVNGLPTATRAETFQDPALTSLGVFMQSAIIFLITFRASIAYGRYWEAASLSFQILGSWINAASNVFSFCSTKPEKKAEVQEFQHLLARFMSLLTALSVAEMKGKTDMVFEVLDCGGIDVQSLDFLANSPAKLDVVLQWIQKLIVDAVDSDVITAAPPITSRAFQELSRGIVDVKNCIKFSRIHFPFCFANFATALLFLAMCNQVAMSPFLFPRLSTACASSFVLTSVMWGLNYIGIELESPFGDDANDLPLENMMTAMNSSLSALLQPLAQKVPKFDMSLARDGTQLMSWRESGSQKELAFKDGSLFRDSIRQRANPVCPITDSDRYGEQAPAPQEGIARPQGPDLPPKAPDELPSPTKRHVQDITKMHREDANTSIERYLRLIAEDVRMLSKVILEFRDVQELEIPEESHWRTLGNSGNKPARNHAATDLLLHTSPVSVVF